MNVVFRELTVSTSNQVDLVDITDEIENTVRNSGIKNGICLVYVPHSTAAIIVTEHESGLLQDVLRKVREEYPRGAGWKHDLIDDNANAHLGSALISSSRIFPVKDGKLVRGTWQNVFLLDLDGPRRFRRILIEVLGF